MPEQEPNYELPLLLFDCIYENYFLKHQLLLKKLILKNQHYGGKIKNLYLIMLMKTLQNFLDL